MPAQEPGASPRGTALRLAGLMAIVITALTRMFVGFDPFPGWDADPFIQDTPSTQVGPAGSILLDVITMAGAALAMLGVAIGRLRVNVPVWAAVAAGVIVIAWHAELGGDTVLDHLRVGSQWAAALIGAAAAFEVCREERARRLALAAVLGAVAMLACKSALQVLVEHPQTVALFRQNRLEFFASQGWTPDSGAARAFERRLMQPEATGWFGMANVLASWGAFGAASLLAMLLFTRVRGATPRRDRWVPACLTLGLLAGVACVAMAGAKGGWAALALGAGACACVFVVEGRWSGLRAAHAALVRFAPIACAAVAILAVVVRGLVGERIGEASVLFRWFYMVGAARTFAAHPFLGVGPDGFKDSYMLLKPPLSPEEVTSPHSLLFDFGATLGLAGVTWGAVWLVWVWRSGRWLVARSTEAPFDDAPGAFRREARILFLILSVPTVIGALVEVRAGTPEGTLARIVGLAAATSIATGVAACFRAGSRAVAAVVCGGAALAAHSQIELTPVWPGSAPAFFLVFGVLGAGPGPVAAAPARSRGAWAACGGLALLVAAWLGLAWLPVSRWQRDLEEARAVAAMSVEARSLVAEIEGPGRSDPGIAAGELSDFLSRSLGRPVGPTPEALRRGVEELFLASAIRALGSLERAASRVSHAGTLRAVSRLALQVSATHRARSEADGAAGMAEKASDFAGRAVAVPLHRASSLGWLGTVHVTIGEATGNRVERELAASAWEGAARADPWGLTWPPKLARLLAQLGRPDEAAAWARKALENDDVSRLDPLRRLTEAEKAEMRRLAAGS